jgi:hypothetical protein
MAPLLDDSEGCQEPYFTDKDWFDPLPEPDVRLVVPVRIKDSQGLPRQNPKLSRNWPPSGWESDVCPLDDSLDALKHWFTFWTHSRGVFACMESLDRERAEPKPDSGSRCVRDTCRLIHLLNDKGVLHVRPTQLPSVRREYTAVEARAALLRLWERVFDGEGRSTAGTKSQTVTIVAAEPTETTARESTPAIEPTGARHSPDFRSVHWFGADYSFTSSQAACVKVLWEAWENGTPEVGQRHLLQEAKSEQSRLQDVFKQKGQMHPAWGTMIVPSQTNKGTCRLQEPENLAQTGKSPS